MAVVQECMWESILFWGSPKFLWPLCLWIRTEWFGPGALRISGDFYTEKAHGCHGSDGPASIFSDKGWDGRNQRDKKTEGKGNGPWKDLKHLSALNENLCLGCRCWVNIRQVSYEAQCLYKDLNACSWRDIASVYHSGNLSNRISHPSDAWSWSLSWLLWRSASEGPPLWEWFVWTASI